MIRRATFLLLLLVACRDADRADLPPPTTDSAEAPPHAPPAARPAEPPELPPGADMVLTPAAEAEWRAREIGQAPKHFLASGWADTRSLWGLTGTSTVLMPVDEPDFSVWSRGTWGADLSPRGDFLAWINERGVWVGDRSGKPRLLVDQHTLPGGESLTGPLLWSPDSERLLVRWVGEGGPVFAIVDVLSGEATWLPSRGEGYRLVEPFGWLDARRVLFATRRLFGDEPRPTGRGGLAVHDRVAEAHRQITDVPEGVFLHPLTKWGEHGVVVGEAVARGTAGEGGEPPREIARLWVYDTRSWSRHPVGLPPGERVAAHDTTRAVVVESLGEREGVREHALYLWQASAGGAVPFARVRGNDLRVAWSPDGRRLVVSREGRTQVVEPRPPG